MNKLQQVQLDILLDTISSLEKGGYKYWLSYGSMIGAVRHKGFIPWDDDIDICMPLSEYEKFSKVANEILPDSLFFQDKNTDKEYPYYFAKIRRNGTKFVQKMVERFNIHQGVYIDIFPLIGVPEKPKKQSKFIKKAVIWGKIAIAPALVDSETTKSGKKKILCRILNIIYKLLGKKRIDKKIYSIIHKYNVDTSSFWAEPLGGEYYCIDKKVFSDKVGYSMVEFEGHSIKAPEHADEYLSKIYGDYMTMPSEDKRISNHQIVEMDLGDN